MSERQWFNTCENHLLLGMKGTGKSHQMRALIRSFPRKSKLLIFDHKGEFRHFFGGSHCETFGQASAALRSRGAALCWPGPVMRKPNALELVRKAFFRFCEWAWAECQTLSGNKVLIWDEGGILLDANAKNYESHPHFAFMLDGRSWGVDTLGSGHSPIDYPPDCRNQTTRVTVFRLQSATSAETLRKDFGLNVADIQALSPGEFIDWRRGNVTRGKVVWGK